MIRDSVQQCTTEIWFILTKILVQNDKTVPGFFNLKSPQFLMEKIFLSTSYAPLLGI